MKRLVQLCAILAICIFPCKSAFGQGTQNVKGTYGCGSPSSSNVPGDIGTRYIDQCANPPVEWIITSISVNGQGIPSATWTQGGSSSGGGGVGSGAAPVMAYYLSPVCPVANTNQCFSTPADTLENHACSWTNAAAQVTCFTSAVTSQGQVASNVATYTLASLPAGWAIGNTITITGFSSANTFFNQTCTVTATTATSVSCTLTHANITTSGDAGLIINQSVGPFTAADVGKSGMGFATCADDQSNTIMNAGFISQSALVTITSFISGLTVGISATPANSQSFTTSFPPGGCFVHGHLDDTNTALLDAAIKVSPICPKLFLAATNYFFTNPHFNYQPLGCIQTGGGAGSPAGFGNTTLPMGFEVEGRGTGPTTIYLAPNFPNGDACASKPSTSDTFNGCFVVPTEGKWQDFRIDGGGNALTSIPSGTSQGLVAAEVATLENITFANYGTFANSNSSCLLMGFQVYLYQVNNAGCMPTAITQASGTGLSQGFRVVVENNYFRNLFVGTPHASTLFQPSFTCNYCLFLGSLGTGGAGHNNVVVNQGILDLENTNITAVPLQTSSPPTNDILYSATSAGAVLYAHKLQATFTQSGAGSSEFVFNCSAACTTYLDNSTLSLGAASGTTYTDVAGSVFVDRGGNQPILGTVAFNGAVINEYESANVIPVTAAKTVLSAGWGSTAAVTALSGGDAPIQFTITNSGTGQGASPTITYTFPTPYPVSPHSCSANQNPITPGTNAVGTFTASALSRTGVTFTFSLTPTASSTEIVQVTCVTP